MTNTPTATVGQRLTVPAIDTETGEELTAEVPRLSGSGQLDLSHTPPEVLHMIEILLDRVEALEARRFYPTKAHTY